MDLGHTSRTRLQTALARGGGGAAETWLRERFIARARALFFARLMFLSLGLLILAVPVWRAYFGFSVVAFGVYFVMLTYSVANSLVVESPSAGHVVTYVTLCLDLAVVVILVVKPQVGGGLQSPLLATQLLFTTLFALLFPKPLAILPPLLVLPITTRLDQLLDRVPSAVELLTLLWYLGLNVIIVYVLVYLNEREVSAHREVVELQAELKDLAIVDERNRLAREIHDGLGANLSSVIIQAEYLGRLAKDDAGLVKEIDELKASAEEAIDELRRSLRMMRDDFDLASGVEDYVRVFRERTKLEVQFSVAGTPLSSLPPETSLALFRVLQEALANAAKHAKSARVEVALRFGTEHVELSIRDDGPGFDPSASPQGHYGLRHMQERALRIGGEVRIVASVGAGAAITISVPINSGAVPA